MLFVFIPPFDPRVLSSQMDIVNNRSLDASGRSEDTKETMRLRFERTFVTICTELLAHFTEHGMPPDAVNWYRRVSLLPYIAQSMY